MPAAAVAVESPTYLGALQAFAPFEPEVVSVACDDEGPAPGARLARRAPARASSTCCRTSRTRADAAWARRAAPRWPQAAERDRPAAGRGQPVRRPLVRRAAAGAARGALGRRHRLPRLVLEGARARAAPGLRGRAAALFPKLLQAKQAADLHTPGFNQRVVHEVIRDGFLRRPRADDPRALQGAARRDAGGARDAPRPALPGCRWNAPQGGMFFWLELPRGHRCDRAAAEGGRARRRVRARRGVLCRSEPRAPNTLAPVVRARVGAGRDRSAASPRWRGATCDVQRRAVAPMSQAP